MPEFHDPRIWLLRQIEICDAFPTARFHDLLSSQDEFETLFGCTLRPEFRPSQCSSILNQFRSFPSPSVEYWTLPTTHQFPPMVLCLQYLINRLVSLLTKWPVQTAFDREFTHHLLGYLDMLWPIYEMFDEGSSMRPVFLGDSWWDLKVKDVWSNLVYVIPKGEFASPFAWLQLMFHSDVLLLANASPPELYETKDEAVCLFRKAWPQKHQPRHFVSAVLQALKGLHTRSHEAYHIWPELVEWWVLFALGAYPQTTSKCLDWDRRRYLCGLWRRRMRYTCTDNPPPQVDLNYISRAYIEHQFIGLYVVKEHAVRVVEDLFPLHSSLLKLTVWSDSPNDRPCSLWAEYAEAIKAQSDMYRSELHSGVRIEESQAYKLMHEYKQRMPFIGCSIKQPTDFLEYFAILTADPEVKHYVTDHEKALRQEEAKTLEELHRHLIHVHFRKVFPPLVWYTDDTPLEARLATVADYPTFLYPDMRMAQRFLMGVLALFRVPFPAVWFVYRMMRLYFQRKPGKSTMLSQAKLFAKKFPRAFLLVHTLCSAWTSFTSIHTYPLPYTVCEYQQKAIHGRFKHMNMDVFPQGDWYMFCPNCGFVHSMINRVNIPGNTKYKEHIGTKVAGFNNIKYDHLTGQRFCDRSSTDASKVCQATEPLWFHLRYRLFVHHRKCYMVCPQPACSVLMCLNAEWMWSNERGPACWVCTKKMQLKAIVKAREDRASALRAVLPASMGNDQGHDSKRKVE